MSLTLTTEERDEARRLIARLGELLNKAEAAPAPIPAAPPAAPAANGPVIGLFAEDYAEAAARLRCDVAAIRAVDDVESNGRGFGPDGRPVILFEPHVFSRLTGHRFDSTHGGVSYPKWGQKPYKKTQAERWDQLLYAANLDREAAYKSASYGRFQIMGFNHEACGFPTVDAFVAAMRRSEREHLLAFVQFVISNKLDDELREGRWEDFARRYNGPAYAANGYHTKLASAHARHAA
ncbi:N-acetylmuramidase family protein [Phenylobacterium sp. J426]|uniref:N-acetylmuramidase family protein n=1 Tax=Phenylobacterium sp. J426 TaxID=2898439 RepID=UPI00215196F4|nr:N-acetylmuramidase family protein [Phenylobacterium sp. J426]MCR5874351.1 N-acetylmuramidase family protein [Phenylobacterium sp. J426]